MNALAKAGLETKWAVAMFFGIPIAGIRDPKGGLFRFTLSAWREGHRAALLSAYAGWGIILVFLATRVIGW